MIRKTAIAALVLAATAGAGFAQSAAIVTPARAQLAAAVNVNAADFTLAQLVELNQAQREHDWLKARTILEEAGSDVPVSKVLD